MPAYFNVPDFVKIGVMAVVFIFLANKLLGKVGLQNFQTNA